MSSPPSLIVRTERCRGDSMYRLHPAPKSPSKSTVAEVIFDTFATKDSDNSEWLATKTSRCKHKKKKKQSQIHSEVSERSSDRKCEGSHDNDCFDPPCLPESVASSRGKALDRMDTACAALLNLSVFLDTLTSCCAPSLFCGTGNVHVCSTAGLDALSFVEKELPKSHLLQHPDSMMVSRKLSDHNLAVYGCDRSEQNSQTAHTHDRPRAGNVYLAWSNKKQTSQCHHSCCCCHKHSLLTSSNCYNQSMQNARQVNVKSSRTTSTPLASLLSSLDALDIFHTTSSSSTWLGTKECNQDSRLQPSAATSRKMTNRAKAEAITRNDDQWRNLRTDLVSSGVVTSMGLQQHLLLGALDKRMHDLEYSRRRKKVCGVARGA